MAVDPELRDQLVDVFQKAWHHADEYGGGAGTRTQAGVDAVLATGLVAIIEDPLKSKEEQRLADLMTTISNAVDFMVDGTEDGYSSAADSMWKAALAAFEFAATEVGATGFQASWAALRFYGEAMNVKGPFILLKAEDALYPQYDLPGRLQTFLDGQREWFREQAKEKLAGGTQFAAPTVIAHWERLAGDDV